jgi:imidazolonepropionase-like amidohydrolase
MKKRFDDARSVGPHVLRAGFIEGRGEKAAGSKVTAETPEEALQGVEGFSRRGYEQLKIYNSIKPELVPFLAKAAHDRGMRVSGHVPVHMRAEEAVRAGFDELNHLNMLFLNFFIDKDTDTRTTLRFTIPAEKAAGLDLSSKPVRDFIALLRERKTVVDPTVQVFESLLLARPGSVSPNAASIADRLPATVRRELSAGGLPVPEGKDQRFRDSFTAMLKMIKLLHDSKVPIVAGTDEFGLLLPRELELYVQAGIPAGEVLELATLGSARVMGKDKTTGSIAVGKEADLVLVDGDPLANIGDVRKVTQVVRSGVRYEVAPLFASVGVRP